MNTLSRFKAGNTFYLECHVPLSFGNSTSEIKSQIRDGRSLVATLEVATLSPTAADYIFSLTASASSTKNWPTKNLTMDIKYTTASGAISTDSFMVPVAYGETE